MLLLLMFFFWGGGMAIANVLGGNRNIVIITIFIFPAKTFALKSTSFQLLVLCK